VNLPPEHRTGGLLAWASIGHEVGGHHLLHFDKSLIPQLQEAIRTGILKELPATEEVNILSEYWGACADELASDVLGVLNIGTCFGIALLGYLRGKRGGKLNNTGPLHTMKGQVMHAVKLFAPSGNVPSMFIHRVSDNVILAKDAGHFGYLKPNREDPFFYEKFSFPSGKHPVDVLRPFCIAKTIEIIDAKSEWIQLTKGEALKDFDPNGKLVLNGLEGDPPTLKPVSVDSTLAIKTAEIAAEVVARTPISCLEGKCLLELVSWSVRDEVLVDEIRQGLVQDLERLPDLPIPGVYYARHVVAASVLESIKEGSNIERVFNAMKRYLVDAYNKIPNPISVGHVEEKLMAQVDEDSSGSDNEYYFQ
jgi:hypothetical protein